MKSNISENIFVGDSEMAVLMRSLDWSQTPLGPVSAWAQSLKTSISILMSSRYPMFVWWGREYANLYNDAYRPMMGAKHPQFLGQSAKDCWAGIWDVVGPLADNVLATGQSTWSENLLLIMDRNGYPEEAYFTFSYSPVRDESGGIGGIFCAAIETTKQVIGERRLRTLRELSANTAAAKTLEEACHLAMTTLSANTHDIPFALLYLIEADGSQARLVCATTNIELGAIASLQQVDLIQSTDLWNLARVNQTREAELIEDLTVRFGELPGGAWPEPADAVLVMPLTKPGQTQQLAGLLIVGISPRQVLDDEYRGFFDLVASHVTTAIANAEAYTAESNRAEALAELNRANTLFFSNVSHEFPTPLTLMLNPQEDVLGSVGREGKIIKASVSSPARILLADDNADMRADLKRLLSQQYEVEAVADGVMALAAIRQQLPDLVLADVMMPELDGFALLQELRTNPQTKDLPIILLSARAGEESRIERLAAGADDYLTKPFSASELLARVEATLRQAQLRREATQREQTLRQEAQTAKQTVETILSSISDGFYTLDRDWRFTYANDRLCEIAGKQREELLGYNNWELFPDAVGTEVYVQFHRAMREQTPLEFEYLYLPWNRWFEYRVYPSAHGLTIFVVEVTDRKQAELVLVEQKQLLELIALGHPLDECLSTLCSSLSKLNPRIRACILLADAQRLTFPRCITPDFAPSFGQGIKDAPINELCIGTCGEAVYSGQPVTCADIANDDRWSREWRELCIAHGILACHSVPVLGVDNQPFGSLMLCFDRAWMPTAWEHQLANFGTQVASIVLERDRSNAEIQMLNQALTQRVDELQALFDVLPVGVAIAADPECRMVRANPYLSRILRVPVDGNASQSALPNERPAYRIFKQGHEVPVAELPMQYAAIHNTEVRDEVLDIVHPDGSVIKLLSYAAPLHDAQGQVRGAIAGFADISDRIRTEVALRKSEEQFRRLANAMPQIVWINNANGELDYVSQQWSDYAGLTLEQTQDQAQYLQVIHPDDVSQHYERWSEALKSGSLYQTEIRIKRAADGNYRWFLTRAVPIKTEQGQIIAWYGTSTDIDDRKQAEAALRQSEERYRYLVEVTPQLVWTADAQGRNTYASQQMCDYIGLPSEQLLDLNWQTIIHPDDVERVDCRWMESVQNGIPYEAEYRLRRSDGAYRWHLVRAMPLRNEQGQIMQWFGVSTDIHDKQELEQQRSHLLRQAQMARQEAERANRIKDEFLAVLSHELRSPLNPILGWSKLLQSGKLDEAITKQAIATIERNAKLQSELIEDLLDVSRILRGKLSLSVSPINLTSTIQAAIETVRLAAEAKSIQIQTRLDPGVGLVSGDSTRLQQVVWNLLANAVKFTPPQGRVEVQLEQIDCYAQIIVSDTGKGITPDFLPHVFEYFRQEDGTTTRKFGGLGLGLAIVQHLVELHGGTVKADSPGEGLGATFTVRLPLMSNQPKVNINLQLLESSLDLKGIKVLVVDDNTDTRDFVAFVLKQSGARVIAVSCASEAITALTQSQYDILLSDIGMPEIDGYMLMQQIKALPPQPERKMKAIALTAYAGDFNQQQALQAGFQRHIAKPIDPEQLVKTIIQVITQCRD